jgi:hypothetical protein
VASKKTSHQSGAVSFKDLEIAFLAQGTRGVVPLLQRSRRRARESIWRAIDDLKARGSDARELERFANEHYPQATRGRFPPAAGETRNYRAQQITTGGPFLRLPLTSLGVGKGDVTRVLFERDRIIVTRGS